ncbi:MAG: DUF2071 domain-containing protein [Armatimonadetes bacterium]|nr:DUF2071 domain-containing protein [Armatimonadota bacterium]
MNTPPELRAAVSAPAEPPNRLFAASLCLTDVLVLTYLVPVAKVASLIPTGFAPDVLPDAEGELCALVQTTAAFCEEARLSFAPKGSGESYREITYRVLGRATKNEPGAYVLRSFYTADAVYLAHRAVEKNADFARATVHISGNPVAGSFGGYRLRTVADCGTTEWDTATITEEDAEAINAPFGNFGDMTRFLLRRTALYFAPVAPVRGWQGLSPLTLPAELPVATPVRLLSARLTPWREWGVLTAEAALLPQSVLYLPSLAVSAYAPRPVKLS